MKTPEEVLSEYHIVESPDGDFIRCDSIAVGRGGHQCYTCPLFSLGRKYKDELIVEDRGYGTKLTFPPFGWGWNRWERSICLRAYKELEKQTMIEEILK